MDTQTFWHNRNVLVTGAAGFIGSHLVERLATEGANVTAFVRYNAAGSRGLLERLPAGLQDRVTVAYGDLCSPQALDDLIDGQDTVFHLAAIIAIPFSYRQPIQTIDNNVRSTMTVLEACRSKNVRRLVHTSSSEVYGTAQHDLIQESHPLEAQSPYAASKIACDKIVQSYHLSFGVPAVTLRPFNTYGPRQSARAIVPTIISQALTQKHIGLGSMHPTRDFTFVDDTVNAFLKIAEAPGIEGQTFHIGSGREISIGELADRISALVGRGTPIIFDAQRIRPTASEVNRLIANTARAREALGWQPEVTLNEGLKKTIEWVSRNIGAFKPAQYTV